jgi:L-2-hydroxycarboxylate dehydrogenase (NAD+)
MPGGDEPVVLDMATTQVARGKIRQAAREGKPLPQGLALDEDGRETTDPDVALRGTLTPIGGPKGYSLALMVEMLTGLLSGGRVSSEVGETTDFSRTSGASFTLIAANLKPITQAEGQPDPAIRFAEFSRMIRSSGEDGEIMLPGEIEAGNAHRAACDGIVIPQLLREELCRLAGDEVH